MPILLRASSAGSSSEGVRRDRPEQQPGRRRHPRTMTATGACTCGPSCPCRFLSSGCEGGQRRSGSPASASVSASATAGPIHGDGERCSSHSRRNSARAAQCTARSSRRHRNRLSSLAFRLHASLLLALLSLLALGAPTFVSATTTIPFGYQTSSSSSLLTGSTYAASAAYDPVTSTLYVVGAAYEASYQSDEADGLVGSGGSTGASPVPARPSDCYLTALALPNNPAGASGIMVKSLGETGIAEACTDVTLLSSMFAGSSFDPDEHTTAAGAGADGNNNVNDVEDTVERTVESSHLLVLGHTAPRGLLTDLRSTDNGFDRSTATYGFGLDLTLTATLPGSTAASVDGDYEADGDAEGDSATTATNNNRGSIEFDANLLGGRLFQEEVVTYPIAGTVPPRSLGGDEEDFVGDDVRLGDVLAGGPEFAYVLLQTSDVDPNAGGDNNFGFGMPQDAQEEEDDDAEMQQPGGRSNNNDSNNGGVDEDEEEQDPTVPSSGGSSLVVKKVALTSTTGALAGGGDDSQTNTMVGSTMIDQWTQQFSSLDGTSVTAADLIYVPRTVVTKTNTDGTKITKSDFLLLAGSTRGFGPSFGQSAPDGTYDTDGFVTLLDPATGQLVDPAKLTVTGRGKTSLRIRSTFDGHDVVHGLCLDTTQSEHVNTVYVVGSTTGTLIRPSSKATTNPVDGSLQIERPTRDSVLGSATPRRRAFVMKLNLDEGLVAEWIREYHAVKDGDDGADAYATGCAVSSVDGAVYVGGVVTDGGRVNGDGTERHRHVSAGGDDVFLVRVDGTTGRADWTRQIGSRGDDRLASRGGVLVDGNGGAILVGTTGGSLMRSREYDDDTVSRDAFVMSITGQGETVTPVDPGAMADFSNEDRNCYFVNDPILYLVIVSIVSALCSFVLGHALRQRQGLTGIIARYSSNAREVKGTVVKKNEPRRCDVDTRHLLVQYVAPSSSGGRLIKRLDNVSKAVHQNLSVGSLVNLHILPGHDKSGIVLQELRLASRRLGRDAALVSILFLASFGMSILFASCLPWYGWVIATVPLFVTASMAWLLWRNAGPNMELVFIHGQGCILSGRGEAAGVAAADDCEWTDNDQTDDDNSSPTRNNDVV